jgi:hypothetical protein
MFYLLPLFIYASLTIIVSQVFQYWSSNCRLINLNSRGMLENSFQEI